MIMVLENVYIIPHGDEIVTLPNPESAHMNKKIKEIAREDRSNTLVIISPHSIRLSKMIGVVNTEYLRGRLRLHNKYIFQIFKSNRELNSIILKNIDLTEEVLYITSEGKSSVFPLDFGSIIPLYFFGKRNISLIGQSRLSEREKLIEFGKKLYHITMGYEGSVSIILSADQAHTHSSSGPYGYSKYSKYYDNAVIKSIKENNFEELINIEEKIIEEAKPDSYWNMLTFYGIISEAKSIPEFVYYYVEKYFGMLFAFSKM